jgi:hypothetical protein
MSPTATRHFSARARRTKVSTAEYYSPPRPAVRTPPHAPGLPHHRCRGPERRAHGWHITREGWAVICVLGFWALVALIAIARAG